LRRKVDKCTGKPKADDAKNESESGVSDGI
jgi:hypothetical protein